MICVKLLIFDVEEVVGDLEAQHSPSAHELFRFGAKQLTRAHVSIEQFDNVVQDCVKGIGDPLGPGKTAIIRWLIFPCRELLSIPGLMKRA